MANPHFGLQMADRPRLRFVRGQDGQQASKLQRTAPVRAGEKIRSGMLISLYYVTANARYEWVAGLVSGAIPYVADHDYDDPDVYGSGNLLSGYPLSSEIEVQVSFARLTANNNSDNTANWDEAAALAGVVRDPTVSFNATTDGFFKLAESGEQVVAYLSGGVHINGLVDVASFNTNVTRDANGKVLVAQFTGNYTKGNLLA